jgi:CRP/FNR family transcriptional regulator
MPVDRPITHSLVKALRGVPQFTALDDRTLLAIVGASANLVWAAGSMVFDAGVPTEGLYVVLAGRVRIFETIDGSERDVVTVDAGDFFGEHSLLLDSVHSKSAQAVDTSELMIVPRESFQALLVDNPELLSQMMERLEAHLAQRQTEGR